MIALRPIRVLGGGLAGLSLGIGLRRAGVPVEIFESGDYPRHRVCGEFVTGLSDATMQELGISAAFVPAGAHRRVTWYLRGRAVGRQELPVAARAISRYCLDARLAGMFVNVGGVLATNTRVPTSALGEGWVNAAGRKPVGSSAWLGLKLHARNLPSAEGLEVHLGDGAYVGLSTVEDGWTNVCGLFRRRAGLLFERERAVPAYLRASGLGQLADRLGTAEIRAGSPSAVAGLTFDRRIKAEDGVLVGDVGAMIPPFTGNGMAMAFRGAALALDPLVAWARGEVPWVRAGRLIRARLSREFQPRLRGAALLHPFFLNRTLQRGLGAAAGTGLLPMNSLYRWLH